MVAAPYYLLAGGIVLLIAGFFIAGISRASQRPISATMRNTEIVQQLRNENRLRLPCVVFAAGSLCTLVSIVWRIARMPGQP